MNYVAEVIWDYYNLTFFKFVSQIADPTLAEMGKNLKEAMKMLEDSQR